MSNGRLIVQPGFQYEVGNALGALFLAEGWAERVPFDEPVLVIPFSESDPLHEPPGDRDANAPPNLTRKHYPPYWDQEFAADIFRPLRKPRKHIL